MNLPYMLIATAKVRPSDSDAFNAWKLRHDLVIGRFPGFISSDIIPPTHPGGIEWTIVLTFRSQDEVVAWQKSPERAQIVAEALPFFQGGSLGEVIKPGEGGASPGTNVTEVILSKIKPGREDDYREWSARMQAEQAKYPGYRGMYLQPPAEDGGRWTTIIRFETAEQLEKWMEAPEREKMLKESKAFIEHEELTRLATSFPGWVPINPATGKGPPDWKTAMLVLLGLFPIVMLEMKFLSPILGGLHLHASLATFIGNFISVGLTSFATMPLFVRWFGWWLFLDDKSPKWISAAGTGLMAVLFAIEVAVLWNLLPW